MGLNQSGDDNIGFILTQNQPIVGSYALACNIFIYKYLYINIHI